MSDKKQKKKVVKKKPLKSTTCGKKPIGAKKGKIPSSRAYECLRKGIAIGKLGLKPKKTGKPKKAPVKKASGFSKPKLPARRKKTRLGQLPPQNRKGKPSLSQEAKKRGIRVTKPNKTRKTKKQLLTEILGAK